MVPSTLAPWHKLAKLDSGWPWHFLGILAQGIIPRDFVPPFTVHKEPVHAVTHRPTFWESPVYYRGREGFVSPREDNKLTAAAYLCVWVRACVCICFIMCLKKFGEKSVDGVFLLQWSLLCTFLCVFLYTVCVCVCVVCLHSCAFVYMYFCLRLPTSSNTVWSWCSQVT